jgi:hypothetical protein
MPKPKHKSAWRVWALSLGEKASSCDKESDRVAIVRTTIFLTYLLTNLFIVAGVIRHWNDENYDQPTTGNIGSLRRGIPREEATLGDACLVLTNGQSANYHISDSGELRCSHSLLP